MLNLLNFNTAGMAEKLRASYIWIIAAILAFTGMSPALLFSGDVGAATLSSRKVTINKSALNSTDVEFAFSFTAPTTSSDQQGIIYQFCTQALSSPCVLPTGMNLAGAVHDAQSGFPTNATAFAIDNEADEGDCTMDVDSYELCFERTQAGTGGGALTHTISGITGPTSFDETNFNSVYVRIALYDDHDFGAVDKTDEGNVAAAFVRQITVNGRVAERLDFCVGAVTDGDAGAPNATEDASITGLTDNAVCAGSFPTTSTVDIGVLDDSAVYFSPVNTNPTNGSLDNYGLAAVKTNASNGVVVTYFVEPQSSVSGGDTDHLRAFRVAPTDCANDQTTGAGLVDQCFESSDATGEAIVAGTEEFGMKVACFYQNATFSTTTGLTADANYDDTATANTADCENDVDDANYAWNETGVADTIASSSGVVDDELIKFAFGASTSSTTPTGNYTVVSTYIATPTF